MKRYIYTIMAVAAVLASCTKVKTDNTTSGSLNSEDGKASITTIKVSTNATSKAYVSTEDNTRVLWENGDNICAFCFGIANGHYADFPVSFSLDEGAGQESGTFKMVEDPIISLVTRIHTIVYPETAFIMPLGSHGEYDRLVLNMPTVQKARKGSFDKDAAIMYDIPSYAGNIDDLHLKYAVNFLKITLTESVNSVIIEADEPLSGKIEISNTVISPYYEGAVNHVELKAEDGGLIEPGVYYIAVRPCDIHNPTVTFRTPHSIKIKKSKGTLSFAEGKNVKPISVDWTKGDVTGAVRLWENGPYWSIKNIGAANEYDPGYYFSWGNTTGYVRNSAGDGWVVAPGYSGAGNALNGGFSNGNYYITNGYKITRDLQANETEDAAVAAWGSDWRIPTYEDAEGFNNNTTSTISSDETYYRVTGKGDYAGDYIIIPSLGDGLDDDLFNKGIISLWTTRYSGDDRGNHKPYHIIASYRNTIPHLTNEIVASIGMNIRPVYCRP